MKDDSHNLTLLWYMNFYKEKEFFCTAIKSESQNSLFNTIIEKMYEINYNYWFDYINDSDIRDYLSYKYASSQAIFLKKWLIDGMKVKPEIMTKIFFHHIDEQFQEFV